jgi:DNA-binding NtrC family response regulator
LAEHILDRKGPRGFHRLSPAALEKLAGYPFPGNIRELENILERALIFCEGGLIREEDIDLHQGAAAPREAGTAPGGSVPLDELEKQAICEAMAKTGGNRTRAAELLGVTRKTILNKMKRYGLEDDRL